MRVATQSELVVYQAEARSGGQTKQPLLKEASQDEGCHVALITIAMSLIVFATGIGTAKLRKGANFGGVGCTCGDYHAVFHGPTCCKCVESGSSTPSTDNPSGMCGSP